ncbi:hypothetical protein [Streptomyces mirabilis]|uniref:hypothetical protein n=1 Tax=Streptomyces mirabilis TaxID=68239 RepID=UPI0036833306
MALVSPTPRRTVFFRLMEWRSKRTYGKVLAPGRALAHNPRVLRSDPAFAGRCASGPLLMIRSVN